MPLVNDLVKLFAETPGILLSGDAAVDLADDVQAVVIRHALNSPNRAALAMDDESFKLAVEDIYVSQFGVTLYNLVTLVDFAGKRRLLPSARKAVAEAMLSAMLHEQLSHAPLSNTYNDHVAGLEIKLLSSRPEYGISRVQLARDAITAAANALDDFSEKGC